VEVQDLDFDESLEESDQFNENNKRKRVCYPYRLDGVIGYQNVESARTIVKTEEIWKKERLRILKKSTKEMYICKVAKCPKRLYIEFNIDDEGDATYTLHS
jgi:hypothetical protein